MMNYFILYFLIGGIVAVWMALIQVRRATAGAEEEAMTGREMIGAYAMIALAWPLALGVFTYSALSQLREGSE